MTVARILWIGWCSAWAIFWLIAGFAFPLLWLLMLGSIGVALFPVGAERPVIINNQPPPYLPPPPYRDPEDRP